MLPVSFLLPIRCSASQNPYQVRAYSSRFYLLFFYCQSTFRAAPESIKLSLPASMPESTQFSIIISAFSAFYITDCRLFHRTGVKFFRKYFRPDTRLCLPGDHPGSIILVRRAAFSSFICSSIFARSSADIASSIFATRSRSLVIVSKIAAASFAFMEE